VGGEGVGLIIKLHDREKISARGKSLRRLQEGRGYGKPAKERVADNTGNKTGYRGEQIQAVNKWNGDRGRM